jgi:DtxR family Mn-dependent transcriptional regulator
LNFGWEDVHVIAEQLEHIQSNALVDKLADFLGNPQYDPHGDPIPNSNGIFPKVNEFVLLSEVEVNKEYQIMGVKDGDPLFLKYLSTINFALGTTFRIATIYEFDNSIIVTINNSQIQLSDQVARRITVQSIT